jgi:hydroxyethylthiazole kinase-like uncharacterized protein yjeF
MLPILDNAAMREADRHTIETLGVPGIVLMENAARGIVETLCTRYPEAKRLLIVCGPGNNGGDGLAAARHLSNRGIGVEVVLIGDPARLSPDAATNLAIANALGIPVQVIEDGSNARLDRALAAGPDLVVDALLGTGLDRPLGGRLATAVTHLNEAPCPKVAVDVPTGLSGASAAATGVVLKANLTVTLAALKHCHVLPPACLACGEVVVVDIGIPPSALDHRCQLHWLEVEDVAPVIPWRAPDSHKGHFGHLLIVAGSQGRGGAVAMAARSAVVVGAGLVTVAVPQPLVPVVDGACLESMTHALRSSDDGHIEGPEGLEELCDRMSAVAVGPGMGTAGGAAKTLSWLLERWSGPLVIDADGVNLLAGEPERLAGRDGPTVLTPHPGELARLLGVDTATVVDDRLRAARDAASRSGSVVVAKGFRTIIAAPDGDAWVNSTGDAHLASGGSGDVLTGTIASLLAQGVDAVPAALAGCWLHGRAGELAGKHYPAAAPAAELPHLLAEAMFELEK